MKNMKKYLDSFGFYALFIEDELNNNKKASVCMYIIQAKTDIKWGERPRMYYNVCAICMEPYQWAFAQT